MIVQRCLGARSEPDDWPLSLKTAWRVLRAIPDRIAGKTRLARAMLLRFVGSGSLHVPERVVVDARGR
jgi:hypothetical protein